LVFEPLIGREADRASLELRCVAVDEPERSRACL
jgi:hypothetical protein